MYLYRKGQAAPLGSDPKSNGVNFAVFSEHAEAVELCLFDLSGQTEVQRIPLQRAEAFIWCVFVEGLAPGAKYGYRVHGKYEPENGQRFNSNKLLVDPYARELDRLFHWDDSAYGFAAYGTRTDDEPSEIDSARIAPKSVVRTRKTPTEIEAIQSRKPKIPWSKTTVYETHVKGFTKLNLSIPPDQRGTFKGLAHASSISYLQSLGITAIELLPVHSFIDEAFLIKQGLSNFWGYNTLNFFSPHLGYLVENDPDEFSLMVETLHQAGIEVILDVVYNHTAESNERGPTLSFRGIDNLSYYRLEADSRARYVNDTGCGNTVKVEHPRVMQLIMDSLRFWAGEMGVDGFRFDLASILGRNSQGFQTEAAFFQAIAQDPLLSSCKLIAEPWDIGPGGYQLGAYPSAWSEWNDQYRDICRRFWRGEKGLLSEFARRIHGSSELFEHNGRGPRASLNFITSHDGFTLRDLVSYRERHNEANKENNADGHHANYSDNHGVEGESDLVDVCEARCKQQRNFIATLFLSQGTPMLLAGDEIGRTQQGNNNAYCQDNEINWLDWAALNETGGDLLEFTKRVVEIRQKWVQFYSDTYIHRPESGAGAYRDAVWLSSSGFEMNDTDWHQAEHNTIACLLKDVQAKGSSELLILFNANETKEKFSLPNAYSEASLEPLDWQAMLDTVNEIGEPKLPRRESGATIEVEACSLMVFGRESSV